MSRRVISRIFNAQRLLIAGLVITATGAAGVMAQYQYRAVPGRGQKVTEVGDDFEDPEWGYFDNGPKASSNIDHQDRLPAGISKNQRVYESTYRGTARHHQAGRNSCGRPAREQVCSLHAVPADRDSRVSEQQDAAG